MLIDWITARLPFDHFTREEVEELRTLSDRIMRYCPRTNEVKYETAAWSSIRSDSHAVSFHVGTDSIRVQGSPARVTGDGCTVFGSGPSAALDLPESLRRMTQYLASALSHGDRLGPRSPAISTLLSADVKSWIVTRIDITENLLLESLPMVRTALNYLLSAETGHQRTNRSTRGDSVYWNAGSRLLAGKAYAKGPHLEYLMRKAKTYTGRQYSMSDIALANRLLRLELKIGAQYIRERLGCMWHELTPENLKQIWISYFSQFIKTVTIMNDEQLLERLTDAAPTPGQAKSALSLWYMIKQLGAVKAQQLTSSSTWYRNIKIMRRAGLSFADIKSAEIIPFRMNLGECKPVTSWQQLRESA